MLSDTALTAHLMGLEQELLQPEIRRDAERVAELLDENFREFGSSGRCFSRPALLQLLSAEAPAAVFLTDFLCERLSEQVVLVTYRSHHAHAGAEPRTSALRSSIWVQNGDGFWRLRFHQGTRQ